MLYASTILHQRAPQGLCTPLSCAPHNGATLPYPLFVLQPAAFQPLAHHAPRISTPSTCIASSTRPASSLPSLALGVPWKHSYNCPPFRAAEFVMHVCVVTFFIILTRWLIRSLLLLSTPMSSRSPPSADMCVSVLLESAVPPPSCAPLSRLVPAQQHRVPSKFRERARQQPQPQLPRRRQSW